MKRLNFLILFLGFVFTAVFTSAQEGELGVWADDPTLARFPAALGLVPYQGLSLSSEIPKFGDSLPPYRVSGVGVFDGWLLGGQESQRELSSRPDWRLSAATGQSFMPGWGLGVSWTGPSTWGNSSDWRLQNLWRPFSWLGTELAWNSDKGHEVTTGAALRPSSYFQLGVEGRWGGQGWTWAGYGLRVFPWTGLDVSGVWEPFSSAFSFAVDFRYDAEGVGAALDTKGRAKASISISQMDSRDATAFSPPQKILVWRGPLAVRERPPRWWENHRSLYQWVELLHNLSLDPSISALVFPRPLEPSDWAVAAELREALGKLRKAGKKVFVYGETFSAAQYLVFAQADQIVLHPSGVLDVRGFSRTGFYANDFLKSIGVTIVNLRSHPYKSAFNGFSESGMTDAEREEWQTLLDGWQEEWNNDVARDREGRVKETAEELTRNGPYWNARQAEDQGLVDGEGYQADVLDLWKQKWAEDRWVEIYGDPPQDRSWPSGSGPRVVLLDATGDIVTGQGVAGQSLGEDEWTIRLRQLRQDPTVAGVVLRIDSPGGSSLASRSIAHEVALFRDSGKPLIVSMGGAAASGGYYMAAGARSIVSSPWSLTGSIGVVGLEVEVEGLLQKLKIKADTVKTSPKADFPSLVRPMTPEELQSMTDMIQTEYRNFVSFVSEERNRPFSEIDDVAQGRVWTGRQALKRGLVDELGGLEDALALMRKTLGVQTIEVTEEDPTPGFWDLSRWLIGQMVHDSVLTEAMGWDQKIARFLRLSKESTLTWADLDGVEKL